VRFAALLFDLDGTLIDSHREICLALARAVGDSGFSHSFAEVERLVDGSPLEVIWGKLCGAAEVPLGDDYRAFAGAYRSHYMRDLGHASALFPGVRDTLFALRERLIPARFSVVSNKSAPSVQPLLARFEIDACFELALGSGGTPIPPKPSPALLLHAAERLGAAPSACVMVGDTEFDVEAGRRAGMRTVAITHGMASRAELERARPDHMIDSFAQLVELLAP
jgi:phosphoglycolate phosphatase